MASPFCACSKSRIARLKIKKVFYILLVSICCFSFTSCSKKEISNESKENFEGAKQNESAPAGSQETSNEVDSLRRGATREPEILTEKTAGYDVKLKSGTKTLKGSVDVSHENDSLLHIDIRPDAQASLFEPDLFGPEKLMVVQVINPGCVYEYMIIPLNLEKAKIEKTFKTFNNPPEVIKGPKNGEFTVVFLEPFPDSGARPIAPCVALKYKNGKMTLDTELMKERGKEAELGDVQSIKDAFAVHEDPDDVPIELADEVINRYYLGRAKEARKFFDKAWPKNRKGKSDAWQNIMDQLEQSPYWSEIRAMNRL